MIDLMPTAEQQSVADAVAAFLAERLPVSRLDAERQPDATRDHAAWRPLAGIGCFALSRAESLGGVGLSLAEEVLAFREYGRHLLTPSVLASVLAREWLDSCGQCDVADRIAAGEQRVALALPAAHGTAAAGARSEWQVFDLEAGDMVLAWGKEGFALLAQHALSDARPVPCTDESLALTLCGIDDGAALRAVGAPAEALHLRGLVLVSALLAGICEAVRDMAVAHANTRSQFGHPIGTFQAIKHRCADMALRSEQAWSQTVYAALSLCEGHGDSAFQAVTAKAVSTRAALDSAADNIQTHGGMGFTAEISAHLFLKRTHVLNQVGGNLRAQHSRLASMPPP